MEEWHLFSSWYMNVVMLAKLVYIHVVLVIEEYSSTPNVHVGMVPKNMAVLINVIWIIPLFQHNDVL